RVLFRSLPTGQGPVDRQHARGKQTARERIEALLDDGSFVEFDQLRTHRTTAFGMDARHPEGDGVVAGYGTIDGRNVAIYAQDFTEIEEHTSELQSRFELVCR